MDSKIIERNEDEDRINEYFSVKKSFIKSLEGKGAEEVQDELITFENIVTLRENYTYKNPKELYIAIPEIPLDKNKEYNLANKILEFSKAYYKANGISRMFSDGHISDDIRFENEFICNWLVENPNLSKEFLNMRNADNLRLLKEAYESIPPSRDVYALNEKFVNVSNKIYEEKEMIESSEREL